MLVGRTKEADTLNRAFHDEYSHFIAVYGRKRIGKTFLVREVFGYRFTFQHTGLYNAKIREQLFEFDASLKACGYESGKRSKNWLEAFEKLKDLIRYSTEKRKIIFLDELSWMDTKNSGLMTALENFWNGFASARKDIVLIVCASATSWVLKKIVHNKGGLYNRLSAQIHLQPFKLAECEEYVQKSGLVLNREQILRCYMILGGIPFYWTFLKRGLSVQQNIDEMFFSQNAPLKDEFSHLYAAVFDKPQGYLAIIKALSLKKAGMNREDLIAAAGLTNSGDTTMKLEELEACGFIRKYSAFEMKKKNAVFQLTDNFTLFYYQFLESRPSDEHFWSNQLNTPRVNTWEALAFERVCLEHVNEMKRKLGISGVLTDVNSWYCKADRDRGIYGSQIDLLIVRKDQVINICEMKYSQAEYIVTRNTDQSIRQKISDLQTLTHTKYSIHPTLVTTYGIVDNMWSGSIQSVITMDDLYCRL